MSEFGTAIDEARAEYGSAMAEFMPDVCMVSVPPVASADTWGEESTGSPATISNIPCGYRPLSARERFAGTQIEGVADHELRLPVIWQGAALDVPPRSTVLVAARAPNPARTFQVVGPLYSSSEFELRVAAALKQ